MRSFVLAATAILGLGFGPRPATVTAPPTVVLLVRHAEKEAQPAQDPPLTDAGAARARALVAVARDAGVSAIIQPGGSVRGAEVIEAANRHGMAMVMTGRRQFRH